MWYNTREIKLESLEMKRQAMTALKNWKQSPEKLPLVVRGARQVGKTYLIKKFGERYYQNTIYINFEEDVQYRQYFEKTLSPESLISTISILSRQSINPGTTLIFFDEIQACPPALTSLKYFQEKANEYHIIAAGSLLGVQFSPASFPVGKVDFLNIYPLTFQEFYQAVTEDDSLFAQIRQLALDDIRWSAATSALEEHFRDYTLIGGMPAAVAHWCKYRDFPAVDHVQSQILEAYENDFTKHVDNKTEGRRVALTWDSLPSQLARSNKKFLYQTIKTGARAREFELALEWLQKAGLVYKIPAVTNPVLPLKMHDDLSAFKIYMLDVGLLRQKSEIGAADIMNPDSLLAAYSGCLAENYIVQSLTANGWRPLRYYTFDRYEIDLLTQFESLVVPMEIKSGKSKNHPSFTNYHIKYQPQLRVRYSQLPLSFTDGLLNIPLCLADLSRDLMAQALQSLLCKTV